MNDLIHKPKDPLEIFTYARKLNCPPYRLVVLKGMDNKQLCNILARNGNYLLYYHLSHEFGHLCALSVIGKHIYFFDPTGTFIDDQVGYSDVYKSRKLALTLANLHDAGYAIHYNPYKLQQNAKGINTCSLFCLLFIKYVSTYKMHIYDYLRRLLGPYNHNEKYYDKALARYILSV